MIKVIELICTLISQFQTEFHFFILSHYAWLTKEIDASVTIQGIKSSTEVILKKAELLTQTHLALIQQVSSITFWILVAIIVYYIASNKPNIIIKQENTQK